MIRVLAIDDEEPIRRLLKKELTRKGFFIDTAPEGQTALSMLRDTAYDVVLLDIVMPGPDGISIMKEINKDPACPAIIVLTGKATVETAVEAMKQGSYDYLTKPYKLEELVILIDRAYEFRRLKIKNLLLEQELIKKEPILDFVGKSPQHKELLVLIKKVAPTDSTVFIYGESGTGKELAATTLWRLSKRSNSPLTALNCATFSENLIESELFGHEKGAFTSAYQTKYGIVEVADKGTLFLDEIAEMPLSLQPKLLRFLDSGEFRRVGGNRTLRADVRVITATNKDLSLLVSNRMFREDLFYRLNVITITLPPLRDRKEDIEELALFFVNKYNKKTSKTLKGLTKNALSKLNNYSWPGNVRELENVIERAVILCEGDSISEQDIFLPSSSQIKYSVPQLNRLEDVEREHILRVLDETSGNQSRASEILGIERKTLYLKLKKYGIDIQKSKS